MTRFRFFGVAAYEIVTSLGQHIIIDPFLDDNPGSPVKSKDLERVDLIIVSHAAVDHLGDTEAIARRTKAPVIWLVTRQSGIFDPNDDLPAALARVRRAGPMEEWGYINVRPYYRR